LPKQRKCWLLAGEGKQEPRLLDLKGKRLKLDLKAGKAEVAAAGRMLLLPQGGDKVVVLILDRAPKGSRWHLARHGDTWRAVLGLPQAKGKGKVQVRLNVWAPHRDDPELFTELIPAK
jgi:hypothetical protein